MNRYYIEFKELTIGMYVMAYSEQHIKDIFEGYELTTIDQTD